MTGSATTRLSQGDRSTMRLILRSRDEGDGWRRVSPPVWREVVLRMHAQELIELRHPTGDGQHESQWGRVRLSERGRILADYI